ncbi:MAG: S9 family peptidase, partial [Alteraurantiacibacter sp.]
MTANTAASRVSDTPLIPRDHLFGNPTRSQGKISPDGNWVSWMAPWEGVMNVFMAPAGDPDNPRRMTSATDRPIPSYSWSPDSQSLLYVRDKEGDENYLLYQVGITEGAEEKCLTPFENTRAQVVGFSNTIKDRLLVGLNNRDARFHDVHMLNLKTGKLE